METFTAKMMACFTPNPEFISLYNSIIDEYISGRSKNPQFGEGVYDEVADLVHDLNQNKSLSDTMSRRKTLYLFDTSPNDQKPFIDQLRANSKTILEHELAKWFGEKSVYDTLINSDGDNTALLLQYFSYTLYSQHLTLAKEKPNSLYLTISPGKELKNWLLKIGKKDIKIVLNILKDPSINDFESISTVVVETSVSHEQEIDSFLREHMDDLMLYERLAWLGNIELTVPELQWPSNLNQLDVFKTWFEIKSYDDIVKL